MKDPIEVLSPSGNRILVILRVEESRDRISFTLLGDITLNLGYSSVNKTSDQWIVRRVRCLSDSRSKFSDGHKHGPVEIVQSPSIQPPVEGLTHIPAGYSELDVILFVSHAVLGKRESKTHHRRVRGNAP